GDVLEEHERDAALAGELDEVRALEGGLGEEDPVVGEDPDGPPVEMGEPAHERLAVALLELVEAAAVHEASDDLTHLEAPPRIGRHHPVETGLSAFPAWVDRWRFRRLPFPRSVRLAPAEVGHDLAAQGERGRVVQG